MAKLVSVAFTFFYKWPRQNLITNPWCTMSRNSSVVCTSYFADETVSKDRVG